MALAPCNVGNLCMVNSLQKCSDPFVKCCIDFLKTKPRSLHQKMWVENLFETFDMNYGERLEEAFDKNEIGIKLMHIYS